MQNNKTSKQNNWGHLFYIAVNGYKNESLLVVDAIGACLSAAIIGGLFLPVIIETGIPQSKLLLLAVFALSIALVGWAAWFFGVTVKSRLRIVICLNVGYCLVTIFSLATQRGTMTVLSWLYFPTEILVIVLLVGLEMRYLMRLSEAGAG